MKSPRVDACQRWLFQESNLRPLGETINTLAHEVARIPDDNTARAFVESHHYSGSYPAARERFGLYRASRLVGVAVFSVPMSDRVVTSVFPGDPLDSVELGRFVLLDEVAANGETWFLSRALRELGREGYRGVVSFSDPMARSTVDGERVFAGHVGTIYQAGNANYLGPTARRTLKLLPDARVFSARAISKVRSGERNWRTAAAPLVRAGAGEPPEDPDARRAWLTSALARFTRSVRHPGNHRYAFRLDRRAPFPRGPYLRSPKKDGRP